MKRLLKVMCFGKKSDGVTMIELIMVIAILGIITAISVPNFFGYRNLAVERVCETNRSTVERMYGIFLQSEDEVDSNFNKFLIENFDEVCPDNGVISYSDGIVDCSIHLDTEEEESEEPPAGEVPWL